MKRYTVIFGYPSWIVRDTKDNNKIVFKDKSQDGRKAKKFAYEKNLDIT